jgi:hypothetical protein
VVSICAEQRLGSRAGSWASAEIGHKKRQTTEERRNRGDRRFGADARAESLSDLRDLCVDRRARLCVLCGGEFLSFII